MPVAGLDVARLDGLLVEHVLDAAMAGRAACAGAGTTHDRGKFLAAVKLYALPDVRFSQTVAITDHFVGGTFDD